MNSTQGWPQRYLLLFLLFLFFLLGIGMALSLFGAVQARTIKVAVLSPDGTKWSKLLKKMGQDIKAQTEKRVSLKIYFGGSQGDEPDVLRKIRVGQLQGGIFTGKTLGDIYANIRVVELPFTFQDNRAKAWKIVGKMSSFFNRGLKKQGFQNLGFFEIGMVYMVSKKKVTRLEELKGIKIWSWSGDKIVSTLIKSMNLVSVPLSLPDVLPSLTTNIIEAAYAPPLGIVSLQWNSKIKYIVDFPIAYSIGAFIIGETAWQKISPKDQKVILKIGQNYIDQVSTANEEDNVNALKSLKDFGIEFIKFPPQDIKTAKGYRQKIIEKLRGGFFSPEALTKLEKYLN